MSISEPHRQAKTCPCFGEAPIVIAPIIDLADDIEKVVPYAAATPVDMSR
ncbi:MAG: hypothetical protein ACU85U_04835 [Gammaproteobacteria bacterium]|jgi:hypothetical protein